MRGGKGKERVRNGLVNRKRTRKEQLSEQQKKTRSLSFKQGLGE